MAASQNGTFTLNFITAAGITRNLILPQTTFTITGDNYKQYIQSIPTTAGGVVLDVSGLTTPRWCAFINRDATNFIKILTAVSGTEIIRLKPGEGAMLPWAPGITAPAAQADTAACDLEVLVIEN